MIQWCNANVGFLTVILTGVYVIATLVILCIMIHANKLSNRGNITAIELERQRTRPVVTLEFVKSNPIWWSVIVKNQGLSIARNIQFEINPEIEICLNGVRKQSEPKGEYVLSFLNQGIKSLAPRSEISALLGRLDEIKQAHGGLCFSGVIKYADELSNSYNTPVEIDLSIHEKIIHPRNKGLNEISHELEKITKEICGIGQGSRRFRVISQDLNDYNLQQEEIIKEAQNAGNENNEMAHEELIGEIESCSEAIHMNIVDAKNALCQVLAIGDFIDQLKGNESEEAFAIIQRNAVANLIASIHKLFEGPNSGTLCRATTTIEKKLKDGDFSINPISKGAIIRWLKLDQAKDFDEDQITDAFVIETLIKEIRASSPINDKVKWAEFDSLRNSIAHNHLAEIDPVIIDDLISYIDFVKGAEKVLMLGVHGCSTNFNFKESNIDGLKKAKAYRELVKVIKNCL